MNIIENQDYPSIELNDRSLYYTRVDRRVPAEVIRS